MTHKLGIISLQEDTRGPHDILLESSCVTWLIPGLSSHVLSA